MSHKGKPFRFKQFEIYQEQTAMKVGTDGVLLGAWTKVGSAKTILDVGCGTGLLSLMLAQKSNARITAVEIDQNAFEEAKLNISISPWSNQIELIYTDFEQFDTKSKFGQINLNNPLAHSKGKVEVVNELKPKNKVVVIGDGYTDYEIKKYGQADYFLAYTKYARRDNVVSKADKTFDNFDDIIDFLKSI